MASRLLTHADDYLHAVGPEQSWNESRYIDFYDAEQQVGGWLRLGMRPNEHHAEMSACVNLPGGRAAFSFGDGRRGVGMCEIHDCLDSAGLPVGIKD